ncbi:hypothetical protein O3M35_007232 [Rhynocoris fuscipes]|uniref:Uncharacterized protein n=1 Tax=Rhynocoris fuscipes TaxID=488301 RepID=A0AAW1DBD6_9HEMI
MSIWRVSDSKNVIKNFRLSVYLKNCYRYSDMLFMSLSFLSKVPKVKCTKPSTFANVSFSKTSQKIISKFQVNRTNSVTNRTTQNSEFCVHRILRTV